MEFIYVVTTIFGMVAIAGMYLLSLALRNKQFPKGLTIIHGLMAALALVLLIIYCFRNDTTGPLTSIIVFVIAALSGFFLNYKDLTGKKVPKWLAIAHGLIAATGFAFLLGYVICSL